MRANKLTSFLALIRLRYLLIVTLALAIIFFSIGYLGIKKARQSIQNIMVNEGKALIESLILSSTNAIQSGLLLESLSEQKLLDIANMIRTRKGDLDNPEDIRRFCQERGLLSLDILDSSLSVIISNQWAGGFLPEYPDEVEAEIIGVLSHGGGYRSVVSASDEMYSGTIQYFIYELASTANDEISELLIITAQADYIEQIMEQIGIGYLLRKISKQSGIDYIFFQSRDGIVFSSGALPPVLSITDDPFLDSTMATDSVGWRMHTLGGAEVLEITRRFESVSYPPGVYRIGMNLDEFHIIISGYDKQIIIIAVVLFLLSLLIVAVIAINQNYFILDKTFKQMQSRTETIFDQLSSAVLAYDNDNKIIAVNNAFRELTGIGSESINEPIQNFTQKLPFQIPEKLSPDQAMVAHELQITTPAKTRKTILLGASPLPEEAGGGVVILIYDITNRKRLEEENRRRERLSEMGDMAAGVAHEIRNPLNAIGIAAQRLQGEFTPNEDSDGYRNLTKNILNETSRLNQILTRFLELTRSRSEDADKIIIEDAISRAIKSISDEAEQSNVKIHFNKSSITQIQGNIEKLQQLFINLIKNSIQAIGESGNIDIVISGSGDEGIVEISVSDSGPGFPEDAIGKIFQPYFTTKSDGSGLGLALAYKTVHDYGGKIEAYNSSDGGAVVKISVQKT